MGDFFYIKQWVKKMPNYDEIMSSKIDYHGKLSALSLLCEPCAHCGGKPDVYHQDYVGDYYAGDQFSIDCSICYIGTNYDKWPVVLAKWNKRYD